MEFSNRPYYPIDMDYTFMMFVDFLDQDEPTSRGEFEKSFPRYLPIHHHMNPQKTVASPQVGRIAVSYDDWYKMHNEFFAGIGSFQRDYFIDNIEKAQWLPVY